MQHDLPILHKCLYFTVNSLSRVISKMAEEEFRVTGVSPSYAFLLMLVYEKPGITQTELADELNLAPSTVTRFIDKLAHNGYLERRTAGKSSKIHPTDKGSQLQETIYATWHRLFERYRAILGDDHSRELTQLIDQVSQKLEE